MIELSFSKDMEIDSQDAHYGSETKTITRIRSVRELHKVTIEDGTVKARGQRAHTTAYLALEAGLEWSLLDQTWLGAWKRMRDRWLFLDTLQQQWYAQPALSATASNKVKDAVELGVQDEAQMVIDERLIRGGVDLENAWFVRPWDGTEQQRRDGRLYFDHEPTAEEYNVDAYEGPFKWEPNLGGMYLAALVTNVETWLKIRSLLPWTSVDAASYESGEHKAIDDLNEAINAVDGEPTRADSKAMASAMLATFDFFPPTLTPTRTLEHGAAVAARHVVEHFQYIPPIQPSWRQAIADEFLTAWEIRTKSNFHDISNGPPQKRRKTGTNTSSAMPTRDVAGLEAMLNDWATVGDSYRNYYSEFAEALTW